MKRLHIVVFSGAGISRDERLRYDTHGRDGRLYPIVL